jgi:hypothetical protein
LYAASATTIGVIADVATGNALISGGAGADPSYGKIGLTTHISGTLAVGNGGTGATTLTGYLVGNGTAAFTATATIPTSALSGTISLTTQVSGTLGAGNGGTGISSYTVGDILYASATTTLSSLADVATGNALISGGVSNPPSWGKIGLTTHVSGTLPVSNGGSGATTLTGYLKGNGTSAFTASATIPSGDITGAALTKADDTNVTLTLGGSPSTALLAATSITAGWSGQLAVSRGGTGNSTLTSGYLLKGNGVSPTSASVIYDDGTNIGIGTASPQALFTISSGAGTKAVWQTTRSFTVNRNFQLAVDEYVEGAFTITPSTTLGGSTYTTPAVTVTGAGDVGIGATVTNGKLTIKNPSASGDQVILNVQGATNTQSIGRISYNQTDDTMRLFNESTFAGSGLLFGTNNSEKMRIDVSGNVMIGGTTANSKLDVNGDITLRNGSGVTIGFAFNNSGWMDFAGSTNVNGTQMSHSGTLRFLTASTERMRIDSVGNVGVGTTSPTDFTPFGFGPTIETKGGHGGSFIVTNGAGTLKTVLSNNVSQTAGFLKTLAAYPLAFGTNDTERMRIDSSGQVGIGTSSPQSLLELSADLGPTVNLRRSGSADGNGIIRSIGNSGTVNSAIEFGGGLSNLMSFYTNGSERMRINSSGNLALGLPTSPYRAVIYEPSSNTDVLTIANIGITVSDVRNFVGLNFQDNNGSVNGTGNMSAIRSFSNLYQAWGTDLTFWTTGSAGFGMSERMRITPSGNVGIGTVAPASKLNVSGGNVTTSAGFGLAWSGDQTRIMTPEDNVVGALINWGAGGGCRFISGTSERMRIDGGGQVGIGTSSPFTTLDVSGTGVGGTGWVGRFGNTSSVGVLLGVRSGVASVGTQGAVDLSLNPDGGNVGIGVAPSGTYGKLTVAGGIRTTDDANSKLELGRYSAGAPNSYIKLGTNSASLRFTNAGDTADLMTLTDAGNLGLGNASIPYTTSGRTVFNVNGTSSALISLQTAGSNRGYIYADGSLISLETESGATLRLLTNAAQPITFFTNGSERMRINSSGQVGIGTSSPLANLHVVGAGTSTSVDPTGTQILSHAGGFDAGSYGASLNFVQQWWSGAPTSLISVGQITGLKTAGNGNFGGGLAFFVGPSGGGSSTMIEAMRIDGNGQGNVGIGTASPTAKLTTYYAGLYNANTTRFVDVTGDFAGTNPEVVSNAGAFTGLRMGSIANGKYAMVGAVSEDPVGYSRVTGLSFWTSNFDSAPLERMRINGGGNVGIGRGNPPAALSILRDSSTASVAASASIVLTNKNTGINGTIAGGIFIDTYRDIADPHYSGGIWFTRNQTSGNLASSSDIVFGAQDNNSSNTLPRENMRITAAGNVGIGTSAPVANANRATLALQGAWGGQLDIMVGATVHAQFGTDNFNTGQSCRIESQDGIVFRAGGNVERARISAAGGFSVGTTTDAGAGNILASGNVTAYSDIRVKDNVEQIAGALDRVQRIRGVTYTRTDLEDTERRYAGVIAQEIEEVLPEAIFDSGELKAVDYNATIGLLIEAIKELTARVAQLEGK